MQISGINTRRKSLIVRRRIRKIREKVRERKRENKGGRDDRTKDKKEIYESETLILNKGTKAAT